MSTKEKLAKEDWSGYCRHSGLHRYCHGEYETPTIWLICPCECHYPPPLAVEQPKKQPTHRRKKK